MKYQWSNVCVFFFMLAVCLFACTGNVQDTESTAITDSVTDERDPARSEREGSDADSPTQGKMYSNARFRDVTVRKTGPHTYVVEGEGQIFEANFGWVVEDGHQELKNGFEMTDAGAPAWGNFEFTIEVEKQRPNSALILILFESSAKDGSRQHELAIPLEGPTTAPTSYEPPAPAKKACGYDNDVSSLGIGLILAPRHFTLFNDPLLSDPFLTVDLYDEEVWTAFCPKFFKPDYGIAHFVCTDSTATTYTVLTDYATVKYLGKTTGVALTTWREHILGSRGIRRRAKNGDRNVPPLSPKLQPAASSDAVVVPEGIVTFCPVEVRGNWVKVKYNCSSRQVNNPHDGHCHNLVDQCKDPLTGWVQWKDGSKLLIDILVLL